LEEQSDIAALRRFIDRLPNSGKRPEAKNESRPPD
jgi:hypothetical protein